MTTAALARAPRAARLSSPELATAVQAPSLGALASAKPANVQLRNGDPFILELQLRIPLGFAFNAPFVERLFRAPPGMRVADVSSSSSTTARVKMVVTDAGAVNMGQGAVATMGLFPLAAVGAFIAAHWVGIVLAGVALAVLVGSVTGKVPAGAIVKGAAKALDNTVLIVAGVALIALVGLVKN